MCYSDMRDHLQVLLLAEQQEEQVAELLVGVRVEVRVAGLELEWGL